MAIPIINLKRAFQPASADDGWRILVDRLWPRGINKDRAAIKLWYKVIAPSIELRKSFGHEVEKWPDFRQKYKQELRANKVALEELLNVVRQHPVITLVYAAKDEEHNNAVVLKEVLTNLLKK
ncbi:Uncharacterized conserved protein YeaO, DUF488 family [Arachidicoccus rhizosphaerae]|jgi:uncharacterized protein YeaO (DUF488 family)|uniref:Uncharacterized conserved protein YeaO, DUF488 family n=1 Tax=Arachidicoccus rhizosphaerae TaxID=551991 RepID=A0A1H4B8U2_9BACT|nr:DUF488 family protein [Arachidicoccus rhizosphaerae]SEA44486.1 Uncharacterized conserved protein YeaO, DUF488 family [Arachidicoccus rhizosphaerae]